MTTRKMFLALSAGLTLVGSCKTTNRKHQNTSKLHFEKKTIGDEDLIRLYAEPSRFLQYARAQIATAERNLAEATAVLRQEQASQAFGREPASAGKVAIHCAAGDSSGDCTELSKLSPEVTRKIRQAYLAYIRVLNFYDTPIINPKLQADHALYYRNMFKDAASIPAGTFDIITEYEKLPDALDEQGKPIPLAIRNEENVVRKEYEKKEWWETALDNECEGSMSELSQALCVDLLVSVKLEEKAYDKLGEYLQKGSSDVALLDEYVKYYEMSQHKTSSLSSVYQEVVRGLLALQDGMLSPTDVKSVPVIAVVGDPNTFVPKVQEYVDKLKTSLDTLSRDRERLVTLDIDEIRTRADAERLRNEINSLDTSSKIAVLDDSYLNSETKLLLDKIAKLNQQVENSSQKFVVDFQSVFGAYDAELSRTGTSSLINMKHPPEGSKVYSIPPTAGALSVQVSGGKDIVANGIYGSGRMPIPTQYGWLKSKLKKAKKSVSKLGKQVSGGVQNVIDAGAKAWDRNKSSLLSGALGFPGLPFGGSFPGLGDLGGGDAGVGGIMGMTANLTGSLLQPYAKTGFPVLQGIMPNTMASPLDMAKSLIHDVKALPYPPMELHVYGQTTTVDGYLIGQSIGKSLSFNKGDSYSKSVGMSGGMSVSITPFGVGIGANAGVSLGASSGSSVGAGGGSSTGQSMNLGFYGPAEVPAIRVGALTARFHCPNNAQKIAYAQVGSGNVIVLDGILQGCTQVEFFINDDKEGALMKNCASSPSGVANQPCGRGSYTVELQTFTDNKKLFRGLKQVLEDPDFQKVVESAVVSSDPVGSAWRIFENMARSRGLDPIKMRPVIEQYVTTAKDGYLLRQAALELEKLENEQSKIALSQRQNVRTREMLDQQLAGQGDIRDLQALLKGLVQSRLDNQSFLARHYAARVRFWLDLYKFSADFHQPSQTASSGGDFYPAVMKILSELENEFGDPSFVRQEIDKRFDRTSSKTADSAYRILESISTELSDKSFLTKLQEVSTLSHCVVDLADIGFNASKFAKVKRMALEKTQDVSSESMRYIPLQNQTNLKPEIQKIQRDLVGPSDLPALQGMYEFTIFADPANMTANEESIALRDNTLNADFRKVLSYCSRPDAGVGQVVGIALSYVGDGFETMPKSNVVAMREPLMIRQSPAGVRTYRYLDRAWSPQLIKVGAGIISEESSFPLTSAIIQVRNKSDLGVPCQTASSARNYVSPECVGFMLGNSINPATIASDGVARNFFNTYWGGTWRFYWPDHPDWQTFNGGIRKLYFHIFLKQRVNVL